MVRGCVSLTTWRLDLELPYKQLCGQVCSSAELWVVTVSVLLEAIHLEKVIQRQITEVYLKEKQKEEHKKELEINSQGNQRRNRLAIKGFRKKLFNHIKYYKTIIPFCCLLFTNRKSSNCTRSFAMYICQPVLSDSDQEKSRCLFLPLTCLKWKLVNFICPRRVK